MKNLNVKPYQAYHPYNNQRHYNQQNQQQQQQQQQQNHQQQYHHQQQQQQQQHHSQLPNHQHHFNSYTAAATTPPTQRYSNNSYTPSVSIAANTDSIVSTPPSTSQTPPTLGGYLANQQHLQQQQQQLRLQQSYNLQHQQQQHQTSPLTPTQLNMLSLNQNNTYNYNFHFNAICGGNSHNNTNSNSSSNNSNVINNNNAKPLYHNNNNSSSNNSAALSRPQRPNSLNIAAMASLATPPTVAGSSHSLTPATAAASGELIRSNSATPVSATNVAGGSGNFNNFFQQRENVFNFSTANAHNYLQQSFNNYNNIQQQQLQQQQQHHQQQQQQHQLQQFQLLQQQLKQQQQQFHQQQRLNNICEHRSPATSTATTTTTVIPVSSSALSTTSSANGSNNNLTNITAATTASSNNSSAITNQTNNNTPATNQSNNNNNTSNNCDRLAMDACEIANFLANELFMQQLVNMECMPTGVPTLTTPTLTPTTLRSIEESFIQLTSEPPLNAPYQAGFIPPPLGSYNNAVTTTNTNTNATTIATSISNNSATVGGLTSNAAANVALNNVYLDDISAGASLHDYGNLNDSETEENSQESWNDQNLHEENSLATTDNSSAATDTASFQNGLNGLGVSHLNNSNSSTTNDFTTVNLAALAMATAAAKMSNSAKLNSNTSSSATTNASAPPRRGGGRRPATNSNMSPEEEEKRRVRRERNKLAAARCRKRRVDQTNELTDEVKLLERKREDLQKQIEALNGEKQDLEFLLETHRPACQRVASNILSVDNFGGLGMNTTSDNDNITGIDTTLASTARSNSPLDLKPVLNDQLLAQIKAEPLDSTLDSNSSLDGPPSPKKLLLSNNNPMIPPPLPNVATLSASLAAASASLNTPIVTTAPVSFGSIFSANPMLNRPNSKQRPNTLPTIPRNLAQNLALNIADNKPPTDINGVAIQTPSTGMFNFDSLMDGGTGLTPVSGPLVPTCSSQNKHPLELVTPTSEPSKLVSL